MEMQPKHQIKKNIMKKPLVLPGVIFGRNDIFLPEYVIMPVSNKNKSMGIMVNVNKVTAKIEGMFTEVKGTKKTVDVINKSLILGRISSGLKVVAWDC